jgi:hypothetical protein
VLSVGEALGAMVSIEVGFTTDVALGCIVGELACRLVDCVPKFPAVLALG